MPETPRDKGYVVDTQIEVKDLATWQPYEDDKFAYGEAVQAPRVVKK